MEDVEDYIRARWNDLVRTLMSLGADVAEAERVATDALVRCWSDWRDENRAGDVDLLVYGELLALWADRRTVTPPTDADVAAVLVGGAALTTHQAEDLTGASSGAIQLGGIDPWDALYSAPAPVAAVREAVRRARRRRLGVVAGVVAAALAIAAAVLLSSGTDATPDPDRTEAPNAIPLAWWSEDTLHLGELEVDTPGLRSLAQAGTDPTYSVVYGDSTGQVVQVDADGSSRLIGTSDLGATVLGSAAGLVAWIDQTAGDPSIILWDAGSAVTVASLDLLGTRAGPGAVLTALQGDTVYLRTPEGATEVWRSGATDTTPADNSSPFTLEARRQGELSPSGRYLASWDGEAPVLRVRTLRGRAAPYPTIRVPGLRILDARFVDDDEIVVIATRTYLLGRDYSDGVTQSGRFPVAYLAVCDVELGTCAVVQRRAQDVDPSTTDSEIVLAH